MILPMQCASIGLSNGPRDPQTVSIIPATTSESRKTAMFWTMPKLVA